jgi:hypothetical protein
MVTACRQKRKLAKQKAESRGQRSEVGSDFSGSTELAEVFQLSAFQLFPKFNHEPLEIRKMPP